MKILLKQLQQTCQKYGHWWPYPEQQQQHDHQYHCLLHLLQHHCLHVKHFTGLMVCYRYETRSTGTVHTSATARLTSVTVKILIIRICDLNCHQNLIICSLAHCQPSLKISCKSVWKFLCKVANRQTNNDSYISSLAEITIWLWGMGTGQPT